MKQDISMFFPAYNEEKNIKKLIKDADSFLKKNSRNYEILMIVYEGSTDNTIPLTKELMKKNNHIKLTIQPKNKKGVGYAIRMGFENAKYPNIFYADSDNQFNLNEFKKFLPYMAKYAAIAGYRINRKDAITRILASYAYNLIIRLLFCVKEKDVDCAFRYVNKKIFDKVRLNCILGLGTAEILVKARKSGYKIKQIGVHHYPRKAGQPVFENKLGMPKIDVVFNLLKEMIKLKKELKNQ